MKSLVRLLMHVLDDSGTRCGVNPARDKITVARRVEAEGFGFLGLALPSYGSALERALELGSWQSNLVTSFRHRAGLPNFLRGFLLLVFHEGTGTLRKDASHDSIAALRQMCHLFKKVRTECTGVRKVAAMAAYRTCEDDLVHLDRSSPEYRTTVEVGRVIFANFLSQHPFGDILPHVVPRHGPGATADRKVGNQKYSFSTWTRRLSDAGFTWEEFGVASPHHLNSDAVSEPVVLEPDDEIPVRVIFVPKTQKSPRVIAMEPTCMQYAQQGIMKLLVSHLEKSKLTRRGIFFRTNAKHHEASRESSITKDRATLDLSEASDRVSLAMVSDMLAPFPDFRDLVLACRSTKAKLPDGDIMHLRKFASMGSALCFPMEAIAFYSALVARRFMEAGKPVRSIRGSFGRYSRGLLVFGDDLVVRSEEAPSVCSFFAKLCFKVGESKSFWKGHFRESCGEDYYDGTRVTPVYCREPFPDTRHDVERIVSTVSLGNQLYQAGYWGAARYVREQVELILGPLPHVSDDSSSLGWESFSKRRTIQRWNTQLHRFEFRGIVVAPRYEASLLEGDAALVKSLLSVGTESMDDRRLTHHVKPGVFALKRRWVGY